jgi:hypothetical protein
MSNKLDESWRPIPGHPSYMVSSMGRVKSLARQIRWGLAKDGSTIFANKKESFIATPLRKGYPGFGVRTNDTFTSLLVHRVMALAFLGPCPGGHEVRHLDGNPLNTTLANLEYATHAVNMADSVKHGTSTYGPNSASAKLTEADVIAIYTSTDTSYALAGRYAVAQSRICSIWGQYSWRYLTKTLPTRPVKVRKVKRVTAKLFGATKPNAKLTETLVKEILKSPLSNYDMAVKLGVSKSIVSKVRCRRTWQHVAIPEGCSRYPAA